ncbi:MAG TPA: VOC family protein [Spirochaetota bacterium]|nr:VOC family protein [Spirochaetota bacterium]
MIISSNTIIYCKKWDECKRFYRDILGLRIHFEKDWFIEFHICEGAYLSIADEAHTSIKNAAGGGITIALKFDSADEMRKNLVDNGIAAGEISNHPWGGKTFFIMDPEGMRIEIWSDK